MAAPQPASCRRGSFADQSPDEPLRRRRSCRSRDAPPRVVAAGAPASPGERGRRRTSRFSRWSIRAEGVGVEPEGTAVRSAHASDDVDRTMDDRSRPPAPARFQRRARGRRIGDRTVPTTTARSDPAIIVSALAGKASRTCRSGRDNSPEGPGPREASVQLRRSDRCAIVESARRTSRNRYR